MQNYFLRIPSAVLLLALSLPGIAESTQPDGYIRFPFARVAGYDFTNICKGYGDYNAGGALLLFHSGVDFRAANASEYVRTPFDPAYVIDAINVPGTDEWRVIFGRSAESVSGWGYGHLDGGGQTIDPNTTPPFNNTILPVVNHSLGRHVHIDWCIHVDSIGDNAYAQDVYNTYVNPLDYFLGKPSDYDLPGLGHVQDAYEGDFNTGLRIQSTTLPASLPYDCVYGLVHFVARPVSVPQYFSPPEIDSVGVRYLAHRVLKQDPATGTYGTMHWYDWRTLFSMNGFIPFLAGWNYLTLIYANSSLSDYRSEYLLNSCGVLPVDPYGDDPFENIWPVYDRTQDWADGKYCRGAFDTRLGVHSSAPESYDNSTAMIPDGRYCVELYALSHGSMQSQSWRLPVHDVDAENLLPGDPDNLKGFIVDNFAPYVASVMVYHEGLPGEPDTLYHAEWNVSSDDSVRTLESNTVKYYSNDEDAWIGFAIEYSEIMDTAAIPEAYLYGTVLGEKVLIEQLTPCEWDGYNLGFTPSGNSFWQCYRTETGFTDYQGQLSLSFSGHDLSGNQLDSDPSGIAVRTSVDGFTSYQPGSDEIHYLWLPPTYQPIGTGTHPMQCSSGFVYGFVEGFGEFRVQLDRYLSSMYYLCESPTIQGFWLISDRPGDPGVTGGGYTLKAVDYTGEAVSTYYRSVPFERSLSPELYTTSDLHWYAMTYPIGCHEQDFLWVSVYSSYFRPYPDLACWEVPGDSETWLDVHVSSSRNDLTGHYSIAHTVNDTLALLWEGLSLQAFPPYDGRVEASYYYGDEIYTTILTPPDRLTGEVLGIGQSDSKNGSFQSEETSPQPLGLVLVQNPVSTEIVFRISTPEMQGIELRLFDLAGREVMQLYDSELPSGTRIFSVSG